MLLEEQLLKDYGDIPARIGVSLLKNNTSKFSEILERVGLKSTELRDGLAILIQRRLVRFFIFENSIKYHFDRQMLKRRLYFPIYMSYVAEKYSEDAFAYFTRVLARGAVRTDESPAQMELVQGGALKNGLPGVLDAPGSRAAYFTEERQKSRKVSSKHLVVDFDDLDRRIYETEVGKMVLARYNEAAYEVYKAALRCRRIDKAGVLSNLESTKILLLDGNTIVNEKDNVLEYLRYFFDGGIFVAGADADNQFLLNSNPRILKLYRIGQLIVSPSCRRLFAMIANHTGILDKTLTVSSLLGANRIKEATFALQAQGLLVQVCAGEYRNGSKIEHSWMVDLCFASRSVGKGLEARLAQQIAQFNECWDFNYFVGCDDGNDDVWVSDIISMAADHLVMSLE